ncbi:ABC transporter permease [Aneurinibacillus sp. BA2021]|nr:ABC transporter permease [Aneurinibacillus sp. BA2021]
MKINSKKQSVLFVYFSVLFTIAMGVTNWLMPELKARMGYLDFTFTILPFLSLFTTLFAIVLGAGSVVDEYKEGTIKQLLIRPVSRTAVLLAKYLANVLMLVCTAAVLGAVSCILDLCLFGTGKGSGVSIWIICKAYMYNLPSIIFAMTIAFFIGTLCKSSALAIVAAILCVFGGPVFVELLPPSAWGRYLIFTNLDIQVYDSNPLLNKGAHAPFSGMSMMFSLTVVLGHIAALLAVASLVFQKRDVY